MTERQKVGAWMRMCRERRRLTVKQVSLEAGVSRATVEQWELGTRTPNVRRFLAWAHAVHETPQGAIAALDTLVAP